MSCLNIFVEGNHLGHYRRTMTGTAFKICVAKKARIEGYLFHVK